AVGTHHRRRRGRGFSPSIGCVEVNDFAKQDLAVVELVPPDDDGLESKWALAKSGDLSLAASLDALGDRELALARKQLPRPHFAEIYAHRVVGSPRGILGRGFGGNGLLLDFD